QLAGRVISIAGGVTAAARIETCDENISTRIEGDAAEIGAARKTCIEAGDKRAAGIEVIHLAVRRPASMRPKRSVQRINDQIDHREARGGEATQQCPSF